MDAARLELLLMKVARRYAPSVVPYGWQGAGDYTRLTNGKNLAQLTRALAGYNALIAVGDLPQQLHDHALIHLKDWVDQYTRFYSVLADRLFPTFRNLSAYYADEAIPRTIAVIGSATPVIVVMCEVIVPYITARQAHYGADEAELNSVMNLVLDRLGVERVPVEDIQRLRAEGVQILKQLLAGSVQQLALMPLSITFEQIKAHPAPDDAALNTPIDITPLDAFASTSSFVPPSDAHIAPFTPPFEQPPSLPELPQIESMGDTTSMTKPFTVPLDPPAPPPTLPELPDDQASDPPAHK